MHFVNRQPQVEILRDSKSSDLSPLITERKEEVYSHSTAPLKKKGFAVCHYRCSRAGIRHTEKNHAELIPKLQYTTVAYLRSRLFKTYIIVQCNRFLIASSSQAAAREAARSSKRKTEFYSSGTTEKQFKNRQKVFGIFSTFFPIRPRAD